MTITEIADVLNHASDDFDIGGLQALRVKIGATSQRPAKRLFDSRTIFDHFAFHVGGRTELQFNVGFEERDAISVVRHGVAFSLKPSQTLPSIERLVPKIRRFNDYIQTRPEEFSEFRMWHYDYSRFEAEYGVAPIPDNLIREGIFVMVGRWTPVDELDLNAVLADFDRLLPLYIYTESRSGRPASPLPFRFRPGKPQFAITSSASMPARTVDIALRHKELQHILYDQLTSEHGEANVAMEQWLETGVRVDAAVASGTEFDFYELKIAPSVQACVRQAGGQLLEYAHWPNADRAKRLIVVGEAAPDPEAAAYLQLLRERYKLPIWYRQITISPGRLGSFH